MPDRNPTRSFSPNGPATPSGADPAVTHSDAAAAATTGGASTPTNTSPRPTTAGRYEIGEEIAHGGMGVVYRATDTALGREVAVKVLQDKYDPDSGAARRFADEARIAAQLQHPAIPPVHDLGTLPDGRPFLAMKLIKGRTLGALLDDRPDPSHERGRFVAAFEQVCQAVAYAHAHQVIHRDLKPANVMVGAFGEVQVMDWGLAKVLTGRTRPEDDTAETAAGTQVVSLREADGSFTQAGSVLGTPAFMPPEQAVGAVGKIDERSDVFGLGAVLAAILTGQPPFAGGSSETIRVQAAQGNLEDCFGRLDRCGADPDLVALCKGCLAPNPANRPANAGAVAKAVAGLRQAADERARQAELDKVRVEGERAAAVARSAERRKRRRVWQGAAAALAVALVGGLGAVLAVQRRANTDLAAKNGELADEQAKVEARNRQLVTERATVEARNRELADEQVQAETRFELARKAIETFHTGVTEDALLKNEEFKDLKARMLKEAAGFYAEMEKVLAGRTDVKSRRALATGYFQLGEFTGKIGSQPEALAIHRKALAVRQQLAALPGADVETRLDVARSLNAIGRLLRAMGDQAGALTTFEESHGLAERLKAEAPTDPVRSVLAQSCGYIGYQLQTTGKPEDAMAAYQKALDIRQKLADANPAVTDFWSDLAETHRLIGQLLGKTGKEEDGRVSFQKAIDIQQKLADANPTVTGFWRHLATTHLNFGAMLSQTKKPLDALPSLRRALDIRQKLADANRPVSAYQDELAQIYYTIGVVHIRGDNWAEALRETEKAQLIYQKLTDSHPSATEYQSALARCHNLIGNTLWDTEKLPEGLAECQLALNLKKKIAAANPSVTHYRSDLARSYCSVGIKLAGLGQLAEGAATYNQGIVILRQLDHDHPTVTEYKTSLTDALRDWTTTLTSLNRTHSEAGVRLINSWRWKEAIAEFEECRLVVEQLVAANPDLPGHRRDLARAQTNIGRLMERTGRPTEALALYHKARNLQLDLVKENPKATDYQSELARCHDAIGRLLASQKQFTDAFTALNKGLDVRQKLADDNPKNALYASELGSSHGSRGWARVRAGHPAEAAADLRRAIELWAKYLTPDMETRFERVRTLALLAKLGADAKAGVTAAETAAFADRAVAALADAVKGGWALRDELNEPDFDALRGREDFQKLLKELDAKTLKILEVAPPPRPKE